MAHELENKLEEDQVRSMEELQKLSILLTLVTAIFLTGLIIITSSATSAVDARHSLYSMMASFVFFLCLTFMSFSLRFSLFRMTITSCVIVLQSGSFLLLLSLHTLLSIILGGTNSSFSLLLLTMLFVLCFVHITTYVLFLLLVSWTTKSAWAREQCLYYI
ncbi:hypothetical protein MtrunA17_Chr5g0427131 [Medicago truncatula]|uniref:Transmembrane protein n=1 Tax=Medicago truncatula TaxID=3880 RepID=A0A396HS99_MEDTR|nr:hypothetical protein MtrunA17_Chr5g0427131 [Medicago truncatula]